MTQARPPKPSARTRLLDGAISVFRENGYNASSVDELCAVAGVTKGAFFYHFKSKEDLAVATAARWTEVGGAMFAQAGHHALTNPLARVTGYLKLREALLAGTVTEFSCLAGTLLQETHAKSAEIRAASYACITDHAATLEADFADAIAASGRLDCPSARSLALHTQTVLQGAFIMAKGSGDAAIAREAIGHLRRYLMFLFATSEGDSK